MGEETKYDCYSKFDLEKHKKKYIDYLEIVVIENAESFFKEISNQSIITAHEAQAVIEILKKGINTLVKKTFNGEERHSNTHITTLLDGDEFAQVTCIRAP